MLFLIPNRKLPVRVKSFTITNLEMSAKMFQNDYYFLQQIHLQQMVPLYRYNTIAWNNFFF